LHLNAQSACLTLKRYGDDRGRDGHDVVSSEWGGGLRWDAEPWQGV
jgi:hypothetical protein